MKEEIWSIRRMRELQKLSTTRNTYKSNDASDDSDYFEKEEEFEKPIFNKLLTRLQYLLDE